MKKIHRIALAIAVLFLTAALISPVGAVHAAAVTSISVSPGVTIVAVGSTQQFSATAYDSFVMSPVSPQPTFIWDTSDHSIGTIDASGLFTPVASGTVTVNATSGLISGTATVTVVSAGGPTFASISVDTTTGMFLTNISVGATEQLQAIALDAFGMTPVNPQPTFIWASSDSAVGTVDASGLFTAVSVGTVTITASNSGISGSLTISVLANAGPPVLTAINITQVPANNTLQVGQGWGLKAVAVDETGANFSPQPTFTWSTSNSAVMTVTPYPNDTSTVYIKAMSVGTTTITASGNGINGTLNMTVPNNPACASSVIVSPGSTSIIMGNTQQLTTVVTDQYGATMPGATVYWLNSASGVASANSSGLVTGLIPGQAVFTPITNGCYGTVYGNSAAITVMPVPGTFGITASAGLNGSISPSGYTSVISGGSQTYTIAPTAGFAVADVLIDGISVGTTTTYAFSNVLANHTISATFSAIPPVTFNIVSSTGTNGTITPLGTTAVTSGGSQTYTITPNTGYVVSDVQVDGASVGAVTTYSFTNVIAPHTINATFIPAPVVLATLVTGWNLIGWTNVPMTADAFGSSNVGVDLVSKWDAATQLWVSHIIHFPLNNFTIQTGDGVFVHKN